MSIRPPPHALIAFLFLAATMTHATEVPLTVTDAWIAEGPPGASVLAAYLTLDNPSDREAVIVGASSPAVAEAEIHRTVFRDGMAGMEPQARLVVPPKGQLRFEPGDLHIMLIRPEQRIKAGGNVAITLQLEDGSELPVTCTVRKRDAGHAHHHHHHHHQQ